MPVHVMIKRKWHVGDPNKLFPLLKILGQTAAEQPGFLSNQILRNHTKDCDFLVVSRWETLEDWNTWHASQARRDLQAKIDSLIGEKTFYEIYDTLDNNGQVMPGKRKD